MSNSYDADKETFMGAPRNKIPWWPTIRYNCVVFCRACAKTCALDALTFPDKKEITQLIKKLRSEKS